MLLEDPVEFVVHGGRFSFVDGGGGGIEFELISAAGFEGGLGFSFNLVLFSHVCRFVKPAVATGGWKQADEDSCWLVFKVGPTPFMFMFLTLKPSSGADEDINGV